VFALALFRARIAVSDCRQGECLTTRLDKTLKRELSIEGRAFIVAISPEGLRLTLKGKRMGQELRWTDLVSGDAALAAALNASVGKFEPREAAARSRRPRRDTRLKPRRR